MLRSTSCHVDSLEYIALELEAIFALNVCVEHLQVHSQNTVGRQVFELAHSLQYLAYLGNLIWIHGWEIGTCDLKVMFCQYG